MTVLSYCYEVVQSCESSRYIYVLNKYLWYIKLLLDKLRVLEKYSQHLSTFIDLPFKRRQYSIYILENTYIHVISKLGNISFYPHKKNTFEAE